MLTYELEKRKMDITAIQEIRWSNEGEIKSTTGKSVLLYGGRKDSLKREGVGFVLSRRVYDSLMLFESISPRICRIRLSCKFRNLSIICVYAPTNETDDEDKDDFYELLEDTYEKLPQYDTKLILGDFNAMIAKENSMFGSAIGNECLHTESSDNGLRLSSFADSRSLIIGGTYFKHKRIHKGTWTSPDGKTVNQIDHILIDERSRTGLQDVRSYRGPDCGSDHFLVAGKFKGKISTIKRKKVEKVQRYNTEKLNNIDFQSEYAIEVHNRFDNLHVDDTENEVEDIWKNIKDVVTASADDVLGKTRKKNEDWFTKECEEAVKERKKIREEWLKDTKNRNKLEKLRESNKSVRKILKKTKSDNLNKELDSIEKDRRGKRMREFFKKVNSRRKGDQVQMGRMFGDDGQLYTSNQDILEQGKIHFSKRLNRPEPTEEIEISEPIGPQLKIEPPTEFEIRKVIKSLKSRKAPGDDLMTSEMIKTGGERLAKEICKLIKKIWETKELPKEWDTSIIIPIFKKGKKDEWKNYRGISLVSIVYKIYTICVYNRLIPFLDEIIGPYQAGFRHCKSTIDQIYTLREILERRWEYNKDSVHIFFDFKQAYDSIHRETLWKVMAEFGIPFELIDLVKACYNETNAKIQIGGQQSDELQIKTGLRQGCVLSPGLFNIAMEKIYRAVQDRPEGINVRDKKMNMLAFADDADVMLEIENEIYGFVPVFKKSAKALGLDISEEKTKIMNVSRTTNKNDGYIDVADMHLEKVTSFKYLGSMVDESNKIEVEILTRIQNANRTYYGLLNLISSKNLSITTKLRLYNVLIRPVLTYGCETWTMSKKMEKKLLVFEHKVLRKITGPIVDEESGEWRRRYNRELRELTKQEEVVIFIKCQRMKWAGHVVRMKDEEFPKRAFLNDEDGKRPVGRPRIRYKDQVRKDVGREDWQELAEDRKAWKETVEEAKNQNGLRAN